MSLPIPTTLHDSAPSQPAVEFFDQASFLVIKITDYCNLKCTYCHQDALTGKPILIPVETVKNAIRLILGSSQSPKVTIQFHGGEPLLAPDSFFKEVVAYSKDYFGEQGKDVEFAIQTNLTPVTPAREKMLNELGVGISFSMDGPPEINDELRGGGKRIEQNWLRMKQNKTDAGAICLIQPSNWDRMEEVVSFFQKAEILHARFNLMVPDGRGKDIDTTGAEKLFGAKKVVFDHMIETEAKGVVDITLVTAMERFLKPNGSPQTKEYHGCESLYCPAGRSLYSLNPDGDFHACDRIAEKPMWAMGNVNKDFGEREKKQAQVKRSKFHHKDEWWDRCQNCPASKICEFSCSAYYVDDVDTREVECQYTKALFGYFVEKQNEIKSFIKTYKKVRAEGSHSVVAEPKSDMQMSPTVGIETIRTIAEDAFYNNLGEKEMLAANSFYQLIKVEDQYFLYLNNDDRIFEIDELVADIAKFNGCITGDVIESVLAGKYSPEQLKETIANIQEQVPEIFFQAKNVVKEVAFAQ